MKKIYAQMLILTLVLTAAGCSKNMEDIDDTVLEPTLSLTENEMVVTYDKGTYSFSYNLENPVTGGMIYATVDDNEADWITDISTSDIGSVNFNVEFNNGDEREGTITLVYEAKKQDIKIMKTFTVKQTAADMSERYPDAFTFTIPESRITSTSAYVECKCNYEELTWTAQLISENEYEYYGCDELANMQDYFMDMLEILYNIVAETNGYESIIEMLPDFLHNGTSYIDEYTYKGLEPDSVYMPYAVAMDMEGNFITGFTFGYFKTDKDI